MILLIKMLGIMTINKEKSCYLETSLCTQNDAAVKDRCRGSILSLLHIHFSTLVRNLGLPLDQELAL